MEWRTGEGLAAAEKVAGGGGGGSEVTAYSSPGSVSVSEADRRVEREAGGQEGGWSESAALAKAPFSSACL